MLKFNRGNMAYVIIILFINIKLFIDRHLSRGFPGQLHEAFFQMYWNDI